MSGTMENTSLEPLVIQLENLGLQSKGKTTPSSTTKTSSKASGKSKPHSAAKRTIKVARKPPKPWSMHPDQHMAVAALLEEHNLYFEFHANDDGNCEKEYDTNIMGSFKCHNADCAVPGWSSMVVPITIRKYRGDKYNARVYHQRCRGCEGLEKPTLDDSYADRVAYRIKKWRGVYMEPKQYQGSGRNGPHVSQLCEGCKAGHCKGYTAEL